MTIMPSTPRLRTPERSTTASPTPARSRGVAAVMTVRMRAWRTSISLFRRSQFGGALRYESKPVENEDVTGKNEEEQNALKHLGDLVGDAERHLRGFSAHIAQRQDQTRDDDTDRIEAAKEGDDDGGEAITR